MTNKIKLVIEAIEAKLLLAGCKKVFRYPEDYGKIGNQYPFAIIKEGRQDYIATSGNLFQYQLEIVVTLCGAYGTNRMEQMQDLQVAAFNQLFPSATLGGVCMNINPVSVETGEISKGSDIYAYAGHSEAASMREIRIAVTLQDARR